MRMGDVVGERRIANEDTVRRFYHQLELSHVPERRGVV